MKLYPTIRLSILVILFTYGFWVMDHVASANYLLAIEMQKQRISAEDTTKPITKPAAKVSPANKFNHSPKED